MSQNRWFNAPGRNAAVLLSLSVFIFLVAVMVTASPYPDDQDGVNFLFGIERYDIAFHRPHFPGYPVYIAIGKLLALLASSPEWALITLSALSGAGCGILLFLMARKQAGDVGALALSLLLLANPFFFEFSHKIYSEVTGLFFLLAAFTVLDKSGSSNFNRFLFAGVLIALAMGVRLSWWPYVVCYLFYSFFSGAFFISLAGLAVGTAIWFVPQALYVGPGELIKTGIAFTSGHFETWGGAMGASNSANSRMISFATRFYEILWLPEWNPAFLKIPWVLVSVFGLAFFAVKKVAISKSAWLFVVASMFYFLWVFFGQNLEKTRHFIPFIPALLLCLIPLAKAYPKVILASAFALSLTIPYTYWNRVYAAAPVVRLNTWLNDVAEPEAVLYCGQTERFFDRYRAGIIVRNVESASVLQKSINEEFNKPALPLVCDDIPNLKTTKAPIITFETRSGDPVDKPLRVYNLN
ncbi:hypothetical protein MNBD_NITROSPINAE01-473, partial [hydrothermal vent metagenome]